MAQHPGGTLSPDSILLDYDGSGNVIYVGVAYPKQIASDAVWQIRKLTYDGSGNLLTLLYANGSKDFLFIWNDRAGYTYY